MFNHKLTYRAAAFLIAFAATSAPRNALSRKEPAVESRYDIGAKMVTHARKYLGVNYNWEGRMTTKYPGLDCLGLIYRVIQEELKILWAKWSVYPSELILQLNRDEKAHRTVFLTSNLDVSKLLTDLKEGDMIFFLSTPSTSDKPVAKSNETEYWVWHTGIYTGNGNFIHASPFDERYAVVEEPFVDFMRRIEFSGFLSVTPDFDDIARMRGK